mmetsp:Transcript_55027/g.98086  ORF Transcript_55027/g.98086 Transcript_55027/m.98086 type:complete len:1062 (+) Transcript_55027:21-3206(+)
MVASLPSAAMSGRKPPAVQPLAPKISADSQVPNLGRVSHEEETPRHRRVQCSWEEMQRRLNRRAGLVSEFDDHPRLLAAAEDLEPSAWYRRIDNWPDVAKASSKLRRKTTAAEKEESKSADALSLEGMEDIIPWLREVYGDEFIAQNFPSAVSNPRGLRASSIRPQTTPSATGSLRTPSLYTPRPARKLAEEPARKLVDRDPKQVTVSGLECENLECQPRTLARQNFDLFQDPFAAADEFTIAKKKADRKAQKVKNHLPKSSAMEAALNASAERAASKRPSSPGQAMPLEQPIRDRILDRLDYVHSCRETMGESRFAAQRQRMEMQAQLKSAAKYSVEERSREDRNAFSASVRASAKEPSEKVEQTALDALDLLGSLGTLRPSTAPAVSVKVMEDVAVSPERRVGAEEETAVRTFKYASKCAENKLAMPTLGNFGLAATGRGRSGSPERPATASLVLPHWSLGDAPVLALSSSPLRESLALVEEGELRGNRLSNSGVAALMPHMGMQTIKLDLSENCFEAQGIEAVKTFIRRATNLQDLNLSNNHLSDASVASLCRKLADCCRRSLTRLGLSDVQIGVGASTGPALGQLLEVGYKMRSLDVSFNMLSAAGAIPIIEGLQSSNLEQLDLGCNCLGQGDGSSLVAEKLAVVLRDMDKLKHLDISFNRLRHKEVEVIGRGLAVNRSLWGLHVEGNSAVLDANGFLHTVVDNVEPSAESLSAPKSPPKKKTGGKKAKSARGKEAAEGEFDPRGDRVSTEELEERTKELQWDLQISEATREWQEQERLMGEAARRNLSQRLQKELEDGPANKLGSRFPVSLPSDMRDICRPDAGRPLHPLLQDNFVQSAVMQVRPELRNSLMGLGCQIAGDLGATAKSIWTRRLGSCWLCSAWVEVSLALSPRALRHVPGQDHVVCALFSIDNFSKPVPLELQSDGRWIGSRFLPPSDEAMHVIFQVDDHLEVSGELPTRSLPGLQLPLWRRTGASDEQPVVAEIKEVNLLQVGQFAETFCAKLRSKPADSVHPPDQTAVVQQTASQAAESETGKLRERLTGWVQAGYKSTEPWSA